MMSKHIFGDTPQRRVFVAMAATASMLLAISCPVAAADTGGGTGGSGSKHHSQTGGGETGTSKVTSTIKQPDSDHRDSTGSTGSQTNGTQIRSGSQKTVLHHNSEPTGALDPDTFGSHGTGNTNSGHNTNPAHKPFTNTLTGTVNGQQTGKTRALTSDLANRNAGTGKLGNFGTSKTSSANAGIGNQAISNLAANDPPASDPDFMSSPTIGFFGLFSNSSFADPDDNNFVATVFTTPFFSDILTSGADPSGSVGFGAAGVGVAGETVNTIESPVFPFLDTTIALPVTDPLASIFTMFLPFGF